jgi:hypothetical protein
LLQVELVHEGPYPEYRYRLADKGRNASCAVPEDAHLAIEKAALFAKDRTASELSLLTHDRSRSWNQAQLGEILNIYIDTIPDDEYQRRQKQMRALGKDLADMFGGSPNEEHGEGAA